MLFDSTRNYSAINGYGPSLITKLRFGEADVLVSEGERRRRAQDAERAAILGNTYRNRIAIVLRTADGCQYRLQACVWAVDCDYLVLHPGLVLPIRAVLGLEFR